MDNREIQITTITQQVRLLYRAIQAHSKRVEKTCGLSSAQLCMLHEVSCSEGIKVSELAATLSIHRSTSSNMLDKLEKKGLIYRDRSTSDQRSVHIYITSQGKTLLKKTPSPPQSQLSNTLLKLSGHQLMALETSLQLLIETLHFGEQEACIKPVPKHN
ncbi:MAG: MarR family transcriptional regulator [Desulfobulbus propionicus]|nr:MAG: MarR family transcriptional regulator [Desulfobulbus propionicus]